MGWVVNATPQPLYPRERDPVPIVQEAGWVPGPVWTGMENLAPDPLACSKSLYQLHYSGLLLKSCLLSNHDIKKQVMKLIKLPQFTE